MFEITLHVLRTLIWFTASIIFGSSAIILFLAAIYHFPVLLG